MSCKSAEPSSLLTVEKRGLETSLQGAVDARYLLPSWTEDAYACQADRLAAATEALHVVGGSRDEMHDSLDITLDPLDADPLIPPDGYAPFEPWPPPLAERTFMSRLNQNSSSRPM